jgi:predicted  nucleic acid-binding Zn-ribbon protein
MTQLQDTLDDLSELQAVDSQLLRLKRSQAGLDNGAEAAKKAQSLRDAYNKQNNELHRLSGDLKDCELKLQSIETKLKTNQQRLYQGTVSNPKELVNIEKEIGALQRQRSELDERILQLMDDVEGQKQQTHCAAEEARLAETQHATTVSGFQSKFEANKQEIAALEERRCLIVEAISDKALLKRYEDIRARHSGVGLAKINNSSCGACGMALPSGTIRAVREGNEIQTCENCGRILTLG